MHVFFNFLLQVYIQTQPDKALKDIDRDERGYGLYLISFAITTFCVLKDEFALPVHPHACTKGVQIIHMHMNSIYFGTLLVGSFRCSNVEFE